LKIENPDELERAFRLAKAEMELEEFEITPEDEQDFKAVLSGKLDRATLIERLKRGVDSG